MKTHPKAGTFDMRPRVLDTDPKYKMLSSAAKELYTVMYGRASLSATKRDKFRDEEGLYIIFTQDEAQDFLNCKKDKAMKVFAELESVGLIKRRRHGYGNPYRIYVKDLLGRLEKTTFDTSEKPNNTGRENRDIEVDDSDASNNKKSHTDLNNPNTTRNIMDWDEAEKHFRENIAYDLLARELPEEHLERIMRVLVSKCCSTRPYIRIYGADVPAQKVREAFLKLNDLHIRFVCEKLTHMAAEIRNMDAVCLHLLWNAHLDMEIEAGTAFNRDCADGKV